MWNMWNNFAASALVILITLALVLAFAAAVGKGLY